MQEDAKLIVAEQFDGPKIEFIVFVNQIVGEGGFGVALLVKNTHGHYNVLKYINPKISKSKFE